MAIQKKSKLAIIGTVGIPARYGGFETLVEELVKYLNEDFDITVYCSGKFYSKKEQQETYNGAKLKYIPLEANGFQSIPYDIYTIFHASFNADILLILGVSGCMVLPFVKFFSKKRFFVNIDGIEWKRDKWGKAIKTFLRYSEIFAVETAENVITDNEVIRKYLKATYNYNSNLIEYGGDQVVHIPITDKSVDKYPFLTSKYLFGVCRIEPENNIHVILEAINEQIEYPFVMIGNWSSSEYGKELRAKYQAPHIYLLDPIYEPIELNTLRSNCYLYIHGHSAGGTNPSLVEAMNLALPTVAFDVGYNRETTEDKAFYFKTASRLLKIIQDFDDEQQEEHSKTMLSIAKRRYTWKVIAEKYGKMMSKDIISMKG
jgi:glycosyltransferase involved in cell wall biosynthesis